MNLAVIVWLFLVCFIDGLFSFNSNPTLDGLVCFIDCIVVTQPLMAIEHFKQPDRKLTIAVVAVFVVAAAAVVVVIVVVVVLSKLTIINWVCYISVSLL